jgi:hypothetical protein
MISQLCSGTTLNPVLSVTAPPGLQFFSGVPKPVPIVYGNSFVEGTIISDINAEQKQVPGFMTTQWEVALWQAICHGKIILNAIVIDSKQLCAPDGTAYVKDRFNDGTMEIVPDIYDKDPTNGALTLLPYLSALHGIAHYQCLAADNIPIDLTNKVPKIQYDTTRVLSTGLGTSDDIFYPASYPPIVSAYQTFPVFIQGGTPGALHFSTSRSKDSISNGMKLVFYDTTIHVIPSGLTTNTIYYVVNALWTTDLSPNQMVCQLAATLGGTPLNFSGSGVPYQCSIVLSRNLGNNPASVIWDLLTNGFYGLGLSSDLTSANPDINVASFQNVHTFFLNTTTKPYGVNCQFSDKTAAKDMIKKVMDWTDCILTTDNDGKFYLTVNDSNRVTTQGRIGGITLSSNVNIDSNGVPLLVTDDFDDFKPTFKTYDDTINEFHGKFTSFADSYATLQAFFRNEANIAITQTTRSKDYDLSCLIFPDTVSVRLLEIAKRESWPIITISTVCKIGLMTALINDIWHITHAEYGIDDYFKITKKTFVGIEAGQVKIEWTQCPELMFDLYGTGLSQASASVPSVAIPGGNLVVQNVTFPAGTSLSTARIDVYVTDSASVVVWGNGQEDSGTLVYDPDPGFSNNGDYTIVTHNKVQLNPTKFANEIQANMLGLLNVDTY